MSHSVDDCYSVYSETTRKARKSHTCSACKSGILPGHYYCSVHIVFNREAETIKRCGACQTTHLHLRGLCAGKGMWPDERLACGLDYAEEWSGEPPDEIADLPFLSADERGALLAPKEHGR